MQISGVLAGLPDALRQFRPETSGSSAAKTSAGQESRPAALREVFSRYDVTDITPADFTQMTHRLYQAGMITQPEMQELAAIRLDLEQAGIEPDEPVDLLEFYARRVEKAERRAAGADDPKAARAQLVPLQQRLEWIEKLAVLHDTADELGLDALV